MKRQGNLWPEITSFENLLLAAKKAQRGKRFRGNVLEFNYNLEGNLLTLQRQLRDGTYQPGIYRTFEIFEPKPRIIAAAPYLDRVVHHALCYQTAAGRLVSQHRKAPCCTIQPNILFDIIRST